MVKKNEFLSRVFLYNVCMDIHRDILEKIISDYQSYRPEDTSGRDRILLAYDFAKNAHDGQFRKSDESYISHPL